MDVIEKRYKAIASLVQSFDSSVDREQFFVRRASCPVVSSHPDGNMNFSFFSRLFLESVNF